jgi:hypothetical protein
MRSRLRRPFSRGVLAATLFVAGCGTDQGTGLLALSISPDPSSPPAPASKIVLAGPGINRIYPGSFLSDGGATLVLEFPDLPASNSPVALTVQAFDIGCQVGTASLSVKIQAGAKTGPLEVKLRAVGACGDGGLVGPALNSGADGAETGNVDAIADGPGDIATDGFADVVARALDSGAEAGDGPAAGIDGSGEAGLPDAPEGQPDVPAGSTDAIGAGGVGGTGDAGPPDAPDVPMGGSGGNPGAGGTTSTGGTASDAAMPSPFVTASDGSYTDKVQVAWSAVSGTTSYQVYRNTSSSASGATQIGVPTASPYDDTTATPGAIYYYFVKACNLAACSDFSTPDSGYRSAAPPNDSFAGAIPLTTVPFLNSISAADATAAADDPDLTLCSRPTGTKSVWYSYTPSADRLVYLDTFGSDYDTMIGVFTGARGSLTAIACNDDDSRSPSGLNSAVSLSAIAGNTYYIVVYGFAGMKSDPGSNSQDTDAGVAATATALQFHATTFYDVPGNHPLWRSIEGFYARGITTGCGLAPFSYCPDAAVTQAEMAVFLLRAMHEPAYQPPPATGVFADVPVSGKEWMQPWVEEFYRNGIATGCASDPLRYCPETPATRAATAVYILRSTKGVSYEPPASAGVFADLPVAGKEWMQPWVEESYREGIMIRCADNPLQYCPEASITRGSLAASISKAYALPQFP